MTEAGPRSPAAKGKMVVLRLPTQTLWTLLRIPLLSSQHISHCSTNWSGCVGRGLSTLVSKEKTLNRALLIPHTPDCVCGYLTDVEGNMEYFEEYVGISKVLEWEDKTRTMLRLKENSFFVFGGDAQDKGAGDVRFIELIIALKTRSQIHLSV
jgi:hypothetical protein